MLGYEGDGNAGVGSGGGVVVYIGGTRGSDVLFSAGDVLEMSVVIGVSGMCGMYMCLARGGIEGVGGEWVTGMGLGFTNSGGNGESGICVCDLVAVVWVVLGESGWAAWARALEGFVLLCLCVL